MKRTILTGMWFCMIIGGAWFMGTTFNPIKISNFGIQGISQTERSEAAPNVKERLNEIYDVNFVMSKAAAGNTTVYMPRLAFADVDEARYFSEFFGITRNFVETDDIYSYSDEAGTLTVDKFGGHLRFESNAHTKTVDQYGLGADDRISDSEAIEQAEDFLLRHLDYFYYEQADVSYTAGNFEVLFIDRLGNLKNYGFPTRVTLSGTGHVLSVNHYYFIYDKLDNFPIKPMSEAYYELPADIDTKVDLTSCSLVYYYLNSLLQPCYMFEGKTTEGKYFRTFVAASEFR